MNKAAKTKNTILDIAERAIFQKGFGATSIEEIIAEAGITKSGFFYHFKDKNELAKALLIRYTEMEDEILDELFERGKSLHDDPLHAFLISLNLLAEMMENMEEGHPGCMVATYCYQERLFNKEVVSIYKQTALGWRARFLSSLQDINDKYALNDDVALEDLADMVSAVIDGGIVLSKAIHDPRILVRQIRLYRSYIKLLFLSKPV